MTEVASKDIDVLFHHLEKDAESSGYHLNPDLEFTKDLVKSLLLTEHRYGYPACPCRLASGVKKEDQDIICPCDYRDADITEYGACYCGLYVSDAVRNGQQNIKSIPERRPDRSKRAQFLQVPLNTSQQPSSLSKPVWRCTVCGYLCARDQPPEVCPICKVKKERFERFI